MEKRDEVLKHQLEEWKYLNSYIIEVEKGYVGFFNIILLIITGVILVVLAPVEKMPITGDGWRVVAFAALPAIVLIMGYIAYNFRIVAILRGHLNQLELSMNETIGEDVHRWNSYLMETHMRHNNKANKFLIIPAGIVLGFVFVICYATIYALLMGENPISLIAGWPHERRMFAFAVYIVITLVPSIVIAFTFAFNGRVSRQTGDSEYIKKIYNVYMRK